MLFSLGGRARSVALVLTSLVFLAVMVPLAAPAAANHPNACLDLTPETSTNPAGTSHTVTATLRVISTGCTGAALTPNSGGGGGGPVNIDFEIAGPNDADGNSPDTPDMSCNVAVNQSDCSVTYTGPATGTDTIRGWIDHDGLTPAQGGATEADLTEGQAGEDADTTDVVVKSWTSGAAAEVDCDDQTGPDHERETNPSLSGAASNEVYTCRVTDAAGNGISGTVVRGEVTNAPNDPDATNGASYDTPDYTCTTAANATCQVTVTQVEGQTGTAIICFWIGTAAQGQTACGTEPVDEAAAANGSDEPNDAADGVHKTWEARSAATGGVDAEPETDTNNLGETHTITATVYDQFGAPFQGNTTVRFEFFAGSPSDPANDGGNTTATPDRTCTTVNAATCSVSYTQSNTPGTDLICVWTNAAPAVVNTNTNGTCGGEGLTDADDAAGSADAPAPANDDMDVVQKVWTNPNAPSRLDCTPETDSNPTGTAHTVTCTVTNAFGAPSANVNVDVEATGPNDPDGTNTPLVPDFTCTTAAGGTCSFTHGPGGTGGTPTAGTTSYRAWIDADNSNATNDADTTEARDEVATPGATAEPDDTDVVNKTWVGPPAAVAVSPANDTASVGTCNAFTFTVRDSAGNPVSGVRLDVEQRHHTANDATANNEPAVSFCAPAAGENVSGVDENAGDLRPPSEAPDNAGTAGGETTGTTNAAGQITIGIAVAPANGSNGTGTVFVTGFHETSDNDDRDSNEPVANATKTWIVPEGRTIDCEPETVSNRTGVTQTVVCLVRDRFGEPAPGESVTFTTSGPGTLTSATTVTTDAQGRATVSATSLQPGVQTVTGTIADDLAGNEPGEVDDCDRAANDPAGSPAGVCADAVTLTWTQATPFSVTVDPEEAWNDPGTPHTYLATVRDQAGNPVAGVTLTWVTEGAGGFSSTEVTTDAAGQAEAIATSNQRGDQTITVSTTACATGGDCSDTAVKHWGPDFCTIYGTEGPDSLIGTPGDDVICGFDGNDEISGGGGNDLILGHGGNDFVVGGSGRDTLQGGSGKDDLLGSDGPDFVRGGRGDDVIRGGKGADFLSGGAGNDFIGGGSGGDTLLGRGGNDFLNGGAGRDGCSGGRGRDRVRKCELKVTVSRN
ncbi:MAG TPA: Ig-like domain-containing protein [Actinomycetota bacterium]|nr:Ig-like domain-containing protein [Actinomycetota bacterium]